MRGSAFEWFTSCLSDRKQRVVMGNFRSDLASVRFGIPQGSVLGLTLFIVYVNGLLELKLSQADNSHMLMIRYLFSTPKLGMRSKW